MMNRVYIILLVATVGSGARSYPIDMTDWPLLYRSAFLAGPTPVEWALDDDIELLLDKLRHLVRYYEVERSVAPEEWITVNYWLNVDYNRTIDCIPYFERELAFHRQRLLENPTRINLYKGRPPVKLKLDSHIDLIRRNKYENCQKAIGSQFSQWVERVLEADFKIVSELLSAKKVLVDRTSDKALASPLKDKISSIILPRFKLTMFTSHNSKGGRKKFNELYDELIVRPCSRVSNIGPTARKIRAEYYISYLQRYWLDEQPEKVKNWLKLRDFCRDETFASAVDANYLHFLVVVQLDSSRGSLTLNSSRTRL